MTLSAAQKTALSGAVGNASRIAVLAAGARLGRGSTTFPFLRRHSPVTGLQGHKFIEDRLKRGAAVADGPILAEYLVMANSCHLLTAWRYLGKAAYTVLDGARGTGLHLAYYAELRAAMSILAAAGVGILNSLHFVVDPAGLAHSFKGPTHEVAWLAIGEWSQLPHNSGFVLDQFNALGRSGAEWCNLLHVGSASPITWLADWSIDLKDVGDDRRLRNIASYRVDLRPDAFLPLRADDLNLVVQTNAACIGSEQGQIAGIDVSLARDLCLKTSPLSREPRVWLQLERGLRSVGACSVDEARNIVQTVRNSTQTPGGYVLALAATANRDVSGVFARAFLLLRLATLVTREVWREMRSQAPGGELAWQGELLKRFSENCHLLEAGQTDVQLSDLIADQEAALDDLNDWLARSSHYGRSLWRETSELQQRLRELCQLERVGVWALAS